MKPQSPHHSNSGNPSAANPASSDAIEEWTSSDPVWKLLDEASTPEPNVFFARNVLREVRTLDPAESGAGRIHWKARLAALLTPPRLVIGATACACAFFALPLIPSSDTPAGTGPVANNAPLEPINQIGTDGSTDTAAVSDLSALVIVETLDAAAEDPSIFTRDEVVAMLGL